MFGKMVVALVMGAIAGYVTYEFFQSLIGNTPLWVPIGSGLIVALYVLAKL